MGEDAIECWHQIRTRHNARIRSLRSKEKQKHIIAKYEHTSNNIKIKENLKNTSSY